jgi:hypothetical protein
MKIIKVKEKRILIPDSWEDLSFNEKMFTFKILIRVMHGDLKDMPYIGLLKLLVKFTGYKPSSELWRRFRISFLFRWKVFRIYLLNIPFLIKYGREEYRKYARMLTDVHRPDPEKMEWEKEIIDLGLLRLSEQIDFAYTIDTENKRIIPKYDFRINPVPWIRIGRETYTGKRFFLDVIASTDITARCFVDALDLLILMDKATNREERDECMNKICAMLYPAIPDHNENMLSGHANRMRHVDPVIKFAIIYWFIGIVQSFRKNSVYRILFDNNKTTSADSEDKISIGMNEIALFLKKEGYGDPAEMNLIDYFDAQVKALKDTISKAIGDGVKPDIISQKIGIPLSTINKLS